MPSKLVKTEPLFLIQAFKSLLAENGDWTPRCSRLTFNVLGDDEAALLEASFTKVEMFKALSDLNGDNAPAPNCFSLGFWQFSWDSVKNEVMVFLGTSMSIANFVKSLNAFFWCLQGGLRTSRTSGQ